MTFREFLQSKRHLNTSIGDFARDVLSDPLTCADTHDAWETKLNNAQDPIRESFEKCWRQYEIKNGSRNTRHKRGRQRKEKVNQ